MGGKGSGVSTFVRVVDQAAKKEYTKLSDTILDIIEVLSANRIGELGKIPTSRNTVDRLYTFTVQYSKNNRTKLLNTLNIQVEKRYKKKNERDIDPPYVTEEQLDQLNEKITELQGKLAIILKNHVLIDETKQSTGAGNGRNEEKNARELQRTEQAEARRRKKKEALEKQMNNPVKNRTKSEKMMEEIGKFKAKIRPFLDELCAMEFIHPGDKITSNDKLYTMFRFNSRGEFGVGPFSDDPTFNPDDINFKNDVSYKSGGGKKKRLSFKGLLQPLYESEKSTYHNAKGANKRKIIFNDDTYPFNEKEIIERGSFFSRLQKLCEEIEVDYINNAGKLIL